jgi:regulator of cell morphogenesis and NO signaling
MSPNPSIDVRHAMKLPSTELVQLILDYHAAHIRDLTAAAELAQKVEAVHGHASEEFPAGIAQHLAHMLSDVTSHQQREEKLFASLLTGDAEAGAVPVESLDGDHDAAQTHLERLVRLTGDYTAPAQACRSWRTLYDICRKYDRDFREHVRLEERVLFPRLA